MLQNILYNASLCMQVQESDMHRVAVATGAQTQTTVNNLNPKVLGSVESFEEKQVGAYMHSANLYNLFQSLCILLACIIVLCCVRARCCKQRTAVTTVADKLSCPMVGYAWYKVRFAVCIRLTHFATMFRLEPKGTICSLDVPKQRQQPWC